MLRQVYYILVFFWIRRVQVRDLTGQPRCRYFSRHFNFGRSGREVYPDIMNKVNNRRGDLTRQPDIQPLTIDIVSGFLFVARLNSLNPIEGFVAILGHLKGLMPPYTIQYLCDRYSVDLCQFPDSIANHIYSLAVCSIFHLF